MARSQKFKLVNYDGGLSSHPKPAEAGEFEVGGDATWSMSFKGSFKPSHGSLASWTISQTTTTENSCRIMMHSEDGPQTATFELPGTSAEVLQKALDEQQPKVDASRAKEEQILAGHWWLDSSIFKGLGFTGQWTASDTTYHGGLLDHPKSHSGCVLRIDKNGVSLVKLHTIFSISWSDITDLEVEGPEQASQRFTATRLALLGPLGLAFKKSKKSTVIQVSTKSGDLAVFVTEKYVVHEVKPKLQAIINKIRQASPPAESALLSPAEPVAASPPISAAEQIAKLAALRDSGATTDGEFAAYKADLAEARRQAAPAVPAPATSAPVTPAAPVTGLADELAKLAALRDSGVLSTEGFDAQKAKLLGTA
jgi:hypothetical protein